MQVAPLKTNSVIIIGPHKSGTSAVAGVVHRLGVSMGNNLEPANESNPLGHFEDQDFINLNNDLLKRAGGAWHTPPSSLTIEQNADPILNDIREMLEVKARQGGHIWGWKDPRTCLTLGVYVKLMQSPYIIVVDRDPKDTAASLYKRDKADKSYNCTKEYALKLTEYYMQEAEQTIARSNGLNVTTINYEKMLKNPKRAVRKILRLLPINPTAEDIEKAAAHVKPSKKMQELKQEFKK